MGVKKRKPWNPPPLAAESSTNSSFSEVSEVPQAGEGSETLDVQKHHKRSFFASRRFLFPLGLFLGSFIALLATPGSSEIPANISLLLQQYDVESMRQHWGDLKLSGMGMVSDWDWSKFETEWYSFKSRISDPWKFANDGREFKVGEQIKAKGYTAKYPVVLVPGVISTGLESWSTSPEYRSFFREKLWGGYHMITQVTFNRDKWMAALTLDPETGLDPPGAKVRAAEGIDAASSFVQGYWIWSKIIENLAVVGYDPNNLFLAAYDWRLSYWNLEERDGYFSRLKSFIEEMRKREGRKVVLAAHSMGSSVTLYFLKWVESPIHGKGGPRWVEDHIEAFISIAGTHLGVPKSMSAFLSGEMKDTVDIHPAGAYVLERFFSRKERAKLFRSWAGSASMWIKGGEAIWGNSTHAPDDHINATHTHGAFLSFRVPPSSDDEGEMEGVKEDASTGNQSEKIKKRDAVKKMTVPEASAWILEHVPMSFQKMLESNYSLGIERDEKVLRINDQIPTTWSNPVESRLPYAPSMKMFCIYGHGKETERSYWYARGKYEYDGTQGDTADGSCLESELECESRGISPKSTMEFPLSRESWIDAEVTEVEGNPKVRNGVQMGEGDGTVSLLSLGAMCVEGWKRKRWNPAGIKVVIIELPHRPDPSLPRGGANTSDHVDILGSTGLNELLLRVAVGDTDGLEDSFVSNIREYARNMKWD